MMREEPDVVTRFVRHYRRAGAERIHLFYDAPVEALEGVELDGVDVVACDEAFWSAVAGERPRSLMAAQEAVYLVAAERCASDWLFVTDADEFLVGDRPVRDLLAAVPGDVDALRVRGAEAVWGPGDDPDEPFGSTHFRTPLPPRLSRPLERLLYGRSAPLFRRGLLGHAEGKHFVRPHASFTHIGNHNTLRDGRPLGRWAHRVVPRGEGFFVAHFDAVGFERWREKWRRRSSGEIDAPKMSPERFEQMERIRRIFEAGEAPARRLFRHFYGVGSFRKAVLRAVGGLTVREVFPRGERGVDAAPPG